MAFHTVTLRVVTTVMMTSITITLKCENNFRFPKSCFTKYGTYLDCTMLEPIENDLLTVYFPRVEI